MCKFPAVFTYIHAVVNFPNVTPKANFKNKLSLLIIKEHLYNYLSLTHILKI